jgi:hypothetical protein
MVASRQPGKTQSHAGFLAVVRGEKPPSTARSAFIEAAREAHILQGDARIDGLSIGAQN